MKDWIKAQKLKGKVIFRTRIENMKSFTPFLRCLFFAFLLACGADKENKNPESDDLLSQRAFFSIQAIVKPISMGEKITFSFEMLDTSKIMDSLVYLIDDLKIGILAHPKFEKINVLWSSAGENPGKHDFKILGFKNGKSVENGIQSFNLKSNLIPEQYTYEIVKTFPHNSQSFTQGLEWYNNALWEGTGLNGKSAVMEIDHITGKPIQKIDLDEEFFGEGITIVNDKLLQLTWQNKKGFIYALPKLVKIGEFSYPSDGWGICHINNEVALSDGTNIIHFYEANSLRRIRKIEVWDNKNPIGYINELEAAEGGIWGNKYQTDTLVKIDPASGKVLAYANLEGILKEDDRTGEEDVLNGIAYQAAENLYYVTGKNWPKMFAIRLIKRRAI